jgi:hypothetical protein
MAGEFFSIGGKWLDPAPDDIEVAGIKSVLAPDGT